jgi:hypothetical protein
MTLLVLHTHKKKTSHKQTQIQNLPMLDVCGKLITIAEIPALPYCVDTSNT